MPIYEYKRPDGSTFEIQQSFSDDALTVDPDSGVPVTRVLHAPAVHFKGSGFYNTDYGTRKRQRELAAAAEGPSGDSKPSTSDAQTKSEGSTTESASSKDTSAATTSSTDGKERKKGERPAKGSASKSSPAKATPKKR
jgi:putative FmdB family regulatory protein